MKNRSKTFFLFIIALLINGCKDTQSESEIIKRIIQNLNQNNKYNVAIIIPEGGCVGCISLAEEFVRKNKNNTKILFIFTRMFSQKELKSKIDISTPLPSNIHFDVKNEYALSFEYPESDYPLVIYFNNDSHYVESASPGKEFLYENLL